VWLGNMAWGKSQGYWPGSLGHQFPSEDVTWDMVNAIFFSPNA
jgi:hypothetical protein